MCFRLFEMFTGIEKGKLKESRFRKTPFCCLSARPHLLMFYILFLNKVQEPMSPLQQRNKKVNHSLSFALGPKHLITSKKSQIPKISFK